MHEWELKHGVVPLDEEHPHMDIEERSNIEKRGPVAPRRGSTSESVPLSPTQKATVHEWELKHGIVTLPEGESAHVVAMEVD